MKILGAFMGAACTKRKPPTPSNAAADGANGKGTKGAMEEHAGGVGTMLASWAIKIALMGLLTGLLLSWPTMPGLLCSFLKGELHRVLCVVSRAAAWQASAWRQNFDCIIRLRSAFSKCSLLAPAPPEVTLSSLCCSPGPLHASLVHDGRAGWACHRRAGAAAVAAL